MPESRKPKPAPTSQSSLPTASPMSLALDWVARIMAVSLLMFLPGVAGQWLDKRFGTGFLTLVGFGFGFCAGLVVLLVMVNPKKKSSVDVSESSVESSNELDQGSGKSER